MSSRSLDLEIQRKVIEGLVPEAEAYATHPFASTVLEKALRCEESLSLREGKRLEPAPGDPARGLVERIHHSSHHPTLSAPRRCSEAAAQLQWPKLCRLLAAPRSGSPGPRRLWEHQSAKLGPLELCRSSGASPRS